MELMILLLVIIVLVGTFIGSIYLNNSVPVPEGCEDAYHEAQACDTCSKRGGACGLQDALKFMKEVKS
jgi:zona occludens toxin (predicted ATPase)